MAAFTSERLPSSSRLTIPSLSVTLAWRIFVTRLNFWLSCQSNGSLINCGGYMSHSRVCSGVSDLVREGFRAGFELFGIKQICAGLNLFVSHSEPVSRD